MCQATADGKEKDKKRRFFLGRVIREEIEVSIPPSGVKRSDKHSRARPLPTHPSAPLDDIRAEPSTSLAIGAFRSWGNSARRARQEVCATKTNHSADRPPGKPAPRRRKNAKWATYIKSGCAEAGNDRQLTYLLLSRPVSPQDPIKLSLAARDALLYDANTEIPPTQYLLQIHPSAPLEDARAEPSTSLVVSTFGSLANGAGEVPEEVRVTKTNPSTDRDRGKAAPRRRGNAKWARRKKSGGAVARKDRQLHYPLHSRPATP